MWGRAVAERAEALARQRGSDAAIQLLREVEGIDFTRPRDAPALRALVRQLLEVGKAEEASAQVRAALEAHPDVAAFHEIRALVLAGTGASPAEVRAGYQRAVELDAKQARALEALAELAAAAGNTTAALTLYDRATNASPDTLSAWRGAAELVSMHGSSEEAGQRWEALLREHPWDAAGAIALARLHLASDADSEHTLELARRSVRFGGGPEAQQLLAEVQLQRGTREGGD
jgi:tetratricopeptide (TPR) repeat protein